MEPLIKKNINKNDNNNEIINIKYANDIRTIKYEEICFYLKNLESNEEKRFPERYYSTLLTYNQRKNKKKLF